MESTSSNEALIISVSVVTTLFLLVIVLTNILLWFVLFLKRRKRKNKKAITVDSTPNPSYPMTSPTNAVPVSDNVSYSRITEVNASNEKKHFYESLDDIDNTTTAAKLHPTYLEIIEPSDTGPINQMNITDPDYI